MYRKTYAVVDLNCIANNISELRRCAGTEVMAVVKADAYGHGVEKAVSYTHLTLPTNSLV